MKLKEIIDKVNLETRCGTSNLNTEIKGGYVSDLLSDVIAHAKAGDIWVTLQVHQNIVAVASMKELSGIILVNGREPEEETVRQAQKENIPIFISELPAFEIVGRLYNLGISG